MIENATEAPNITFEVTQLLHDNFRCHVPNCTCILYEALFVIKVACQTEVSNFNLWSLGSIAQKDVFVLDVPVHNALYVDVTQTYGNLGKNEKCVLL